MKDTTYEALLATVTIAAIAGVGFVFQVDVDPFLRTILIAVLTVFGIATIGRIADRRRDSNLRKVFKVMNKHLDKKDNKDVHHIHLG